MDIDAVVQEKLDGDTDFQTSLESLSEEERPQAIESKRKELVKNEFDSLDKKVKEGDIKFNDQKKRAEKAEKDLKDFKPAPEPTAQDLTFKDQLAMTNAKLHEDDVDEVVEYAKFKKISVSDALKSNVIKASLDEKAQLRKTAEATNIAPVRRGAVAPTSADVLSKAMKGDIPEPGTPEAELLWKARRGVK